MPLHIRPVVSLESLKKGEMDRPRNGMDRLTLTEVGELVIQSNDTIGLKMKLRKTSPPFPWEMAFTHQGLEVAQLTGHFIGPSTFRSIFRLRYLEDTKGETLAMFLINNIERDMLGSDYWNDDTWDRFSKKTGLSRNEVIASNSENLGSS